MLDASSTSRLRSSNNYIRSVVLSVRQLLVKFTFWIDGVVVVVRCVRISHERRGAPPPPSPTDIVLLSDANF